MNGPASSKTNHQSPLAIVCGGGSLPPTLADAARRQGRRTVLFPLSGWADPEWVSSYPHYWWHMGQSSRFLRLAAKEDCREVVFVGSLTRPSLWRIRPDLRFLMHVPEILRLYRGGDDQLLSGVARILERYGLRLISPQEVAPDILMPAGPLGTHQPSERDHSDIKAGLALLAANSPFDIGQAVIVGNNQVLAVEGPEGTDQALARVAELRTSGRIRTPPGVGVLVKAPKIGQDSRIDLPAIGPKTVEGVVAARLAGIAVVAGSSIVLEFAQLAAAADRARIFVVGVPPGGTTP